MQRSLFALFSSLCMICAAFGQANNSSQWQTPGNQVVGGVVQMCLNASSQAVPCGSATGAGYPSNATPVTASATGTTAAVAATLAGVAGKTTYICGFSVSPGSATTAIVIQVTVTGVTNTFTWAVGAPATAAGVTGSTLTQTYSPCIPASAANTGIVVTSGALGTGGINNDVNAWGFQF